MDLIIYMEVANLAIDEHGYPCPAGMKITCGTIDRNIPYHELAADFNVEAMADFTGIDSSRLTIITPEQYQERYGDDDGEEEDEDEDWNGDEYDEHF